MGQLSHCHILVKLMVWHFCKLLQWQESHCDWTSLSHHFKSYISTKNVNHFFFQTRLPLGPKELLRCNLERPLAIFSMTLLLLFMHSLSLTELWNEWKVFEETHISHYLAASMPGNEWWKMYRFFKHILKFFISPTVLFWLFQSNIRIMKLAH